MRAQIAAIRADPKWRGGDYYDAAPGDGPHAGLASPARIAHITYRSEPELDLRFGREAAGRRATRSPAAAGTPSSPTSTTTATSSSRRFDANSYVVLTEAMNHHDVGRGRGGIAAALRRVTARTAVAGIDSDRLYPLPLQQRDRRAASRPCAAARVIDSPYGHDGFLIETERSPRCSPSC